MLKLNLLRALTPFLGLTALLPAAPSMIDLVPADAPVVFSISNVPAFRKNWAESPFGKTWNDPQIIKFLSPLRAKMEIDQWDEKLKQEVNMTLDDVLSLAQGEAVIALNGLDFALADAKPQPEDVPFLLAASIAGKKAEVEKLLAALKAKDLERPDNKTTYETEDFNGVTITIVMEKNDEGTKSVAAWAITENQLFFSTAKQQIMAAIDALKNGGAANPLSKNESYLALKQRGGDADLEMWVNFKAIYPIGQQAVTKRTASTEPSPFLPNPAGILPALGLNALNELYVSFSLGAEASTSFSALTWSEKRGLLKFIATKPGLPPLPAFISARTPLASAGNYDFNVFWPTLKEIVGEISPAALGYAQGYISSLNQKLNVDLERGIFGSFAPGVYSSYVLPPGSTSENLPSFDKVDQLIAVNLSDSAAFTQATDALKTLLGENVDQIISKRDYLGQTIFTFNMPQAAPGAKGFSYAITPKTLLFGLGSPSVVEGALQGLDGKAPSFFEQPWVKSRLAQFPPNADAFQLSDNATVITMLSNMAIEYAQRSANNSRSAKKSASDDQLIDLTAAPDFALLSKYWGYSSSYSYEEAGGYFSHGRADHKR